MPEFSLVFLGPNPMMPSTGMSPLVWPTPILPPNHPLCKLVLIGHPGTMAKLGVGDKGHIA